MDPHQYESLINSKKKMKWACNQCCKNNFAAFNTSAPRISTAGHSRFFEAKKQEASDKRR